MNQQIKDYYENEWVYAENKPNTRRVIYCNNVLKAINNYFETSEYMRNIVLESEVSYMLISYIFPEETIIYYYQDHEEKKDISYMFKATSILFSVYEYGVNYAKFKNFNNKLVDLDNQSEYNQIFFKNNNCILDTDKENFYLRVKEFKQKKIDIIVNSIYNLKLLDLYLL